MIKPFIAASSYLNAAPLWYSFLYGEQKSHCTLVSDVAPVRCAQLLAERRAEAALIPVIEYQRQADLLIAPGACVSGSVHVGPSCYIGARAVIRPRVCLPEGTLIGMGAVVVHAVTEAGVFVGNPARALSKRAVPATN